MTDQPDTPVQIPAVTWQVIKWAAGILGSGAVGTLVVLVHYAIGFSGRLAALERDSNTLAKIEQNTEALRTSMEDVKRDVAVLKARTP
jgi:threonine dehydrogenase-like Zn-dependent dehydrogenase